MDSPWRIEMLGGLRATLGDRVVTRFRSHQTAGLLAYLAYHSHRAHPRDELIERLWPERDPESGRNSFRVALSSLRRQLEPPGVPVGAVLVADRANLQLNPAAAVTDVAFFEAAIHSAVRSGSARERAERLAEAVELYQGDLLPGFFDEWVLPERRRLAEAHLHALDQLVVLLQQAGDRVRALQYARRGVGADPLREEAHQAVMRLLLDLGQPEAALHQYAELERILAEELDTAASPETRALVRQIRERVVTRAAGEGVADAVIETSVAGAPDQSTAASLPSGTVTFLMTDVQGATAMLEPMRGEIGPALADHRALMREACRQHRGCEVKALGDGFLAAFQRAGDALACAIAVQRALSGLPAASRHPLRVRMALHTGDVEPKDGDYQGLVLHGAQRILMAGHGGQVLCSEETAGLVRRHLGPGVELVDLGIYRLRDVTTPERLFQVQHPEMAGRHFPPLNAAPAHMGHLPLSFTRFIGRGDEIARLCGILMGEPEAGSQTPEAGNSDGASAPGFCLPSAACRLLTLTGPGGTGKSRLALEVARRLRDPFHGAVWFVPLAELRSSDLVPDKLLDAMHLPRSPQLEPWEQVMTTLSRQPSLLVLDCFEHLIGDGAPLVQTLLERVPALAILVTSRQRLGLSGEQEIPVAPLPVPELGPRSPLPGGGDRSTGYWVLSTIPSVELFVDRAQAARPDFQLTRTNAAAVASLCTQLEGLPLAIELAAAWARMLTPEQMLARLQQRFDLLVRRGREVDPRHGSLRATLDWSYHALSAELQRFFARLSIFRGGWTLEAAEAVCSDPDPIEGSTAVRSRQAATGSSQVLDYLGHLCDCSLVLAEETTGTSSPASHSAEMRYRLLETLREYAAEQLTPDERVELARRHASYYCALAERAEPELLGPGQKIWLERLEREHDNLRAVLVWAEGAGSRARPEEVLETGDVEIGLRVAGALWEFWAPRGHLAEGREHLSKLLALPAAAARTAVRARALACAAILADFQGQHAAARSLHEEGLAIRRELDDKWGIDFSLTALGYVAEHQGDYAAARAFQEEALTLSRERNDQVGIAWSLNNLADVTWHQGDYAAARAYFQESLEIRREMGDYWGAAFSQSGLGTMALNLGDLEAARSFHEASLALRRELGDERGIATSVTNLGHVARRQGDREKARSLLQEGLAIQQKLGDQGGAADSLYGLGWVALKDGDVEAARRLFEESLSLQRELGNRESLAGCLEALAGVAAVVSPRSRERTGEADTGRDTSVRPGGPGGGPGAGAVSDRESALEMGRLARAARLFGAAAAQREALGAPLPPADRPDYEHHIASLRTALGERAFAVAWDAGQALTPDQAAVEALHAGVGDA